MKQLLETAPIDQSTHFVRRIRILPSSTGTRLGMDEPTAGALINSPELHNYLSERSVQSGVVLVSHADKTRGAFSPIQVEVQPPLSEDEIIEFGRLCVDGTLVESWSPKLLNIPQEGVEVTDFRHGLPDSEVDRGRSYEQIASSLHYIMPRALAELNLAG